MTAFHRPHDPTVPKGALIAAGTLVVGVIALAAGMRLAQIPPAASPTALRAATQVAPIASRTLRFIDQDDGGVQIRDAATGRLVTTLVPGGQTGFIRGVMRGMARDRRKRGIGDGPSFTLTAWRDGELSLVDDATGRALELSAFGATNRAAFAQLLTVQETRR